MNTVIAIFLDVFIFIGTFNTEADDIKHGKKMKLRYSGHGKENHSNIDNISD